MATTVDLIRELREKTSCGVIECKKALEESQNDLDKAMEILRQRGLEIAAKKGSREAKEGRIEAYVHMGSKIGVLAEVNCETDFVARNEDFCQFTKDLAMHIAASAPEYVSEEDVPEDVKCTYTEREIDIKERCLLSQPFVKDPSKSVQDYLNTIVAKIGENIIIRRFIRYRVGQ